MINELDAATFSHISLRFSITYVVKREKQDTLTPDAPNVLTIQICSKSDVLSDESLLIVNWKRVADC